MAKKREDYYEDDDRPRPRSRPRDDEDEDDRPRGRRRDDEDDDRFRRRRKKRQGVHPGVIVGIVGGVVALLLVVGLVLWLALRSKEGSDGKTSNPVIDQALEGLTAPDSGQRGEAARRLADMQPEDRYRSTVAQRLAKLQPDPNPHTRRQIAAALSLWATPEEVPALIKYLQDNDPFVPMDAVKHVGRLRDPRLVAPVVNCMRNIHARRDAEKALREMGPMVEKELIPVIGRDEQDVFLRLTAIHILKDVGSAQCLPALDAVVAENNLFLTNDAKAAVNAVRARGK